MLRTRLNHTTSIFVRYASQEGKKRFMQTAPNTVKAATDFSRLNYKLNTELPGNEDRMDRWAKHSLQDNSRSRWAKHLLDTPTPQEPESNKPIVTEDVVLQPTARKARTSRFRKKTEQAEQAEPLTASATESVETTPVTKTTEIEAAGTAKETTETTETKETETAKATTAASLPSVQEPAKKPRRKLRPRKALISLTPNAIVHLRALLEQPEPQLIRIGVQNRGCSGLTYHLEYVTEPGKFDEFVEQDGVKVLIDSKALFSIVGSEMDWIDDKLSLRFIFKNPNSKGTCGCGESFMV